MASSNARPPASGPSAPQRPEARAVRVELGLRSYVIHIRPGLLADAGTHLHEVLPGLRLLVVSDRNVGPLYGPRLAKALQVVGFDGSICLLPPGEGAKSLEVAHSLYERCFDEHLDRSSCLVALGGGVIGDLTGFVAATFLRGLHFVQIPTTLLAMVDASVGGKVAVDHPRAKNAIGAFYQPRAVLIDPECLRTLPERELRAGLAEVIKHGVIADGKFFTWLETHLDALLAKDPAATAHAIERSCALKARVVGSDEREEEGGARALLNFGHTFAHALETCTQYQGYLHGEAVAVGMVLAAELSVAHGGLARGDAERLRTLLAKAGLPTALRPDDPAPDVLHEATCRDKKARGGKVRFVLATALGSARLFDDVPEALARKAWDAPRT